MRKKIILIGFLVIVMIGSLIGYYLYNSVYKPNVDTKGKEVYLYIATGSGYEEVLDSIRAGGFLIDQSSFELVAEKKKYPDLVKAGRYKITNGLSNNDLVNKLRSGVQEPVKITFTSVRLRKDLAGLVSKKIEADSIELLNMFLDQELVKKYGFSKENFFCMFLPNTYQINWNTSAEKFAFRMNYEYEKYWNESRTNKARLKNLTPAEVGILASIVQSETSKFDEMPRVAGVYLNRLKRGMLLQADPTLIYAIGDFTIKRVLNKDKDVESPYNTYKYTGLPPGPIALPSIQAIEAVLNAESHEYIYFCAKDDMSGYHNFAKTLAQHNQNARKFRQALRKRKIFR